MARQRAADHEAKRRAILDRAAALFAERGYARTSMGEIARAGGTSKALLYHYYDSKEQLLYDLLRSHFERLEAALRAADVPGLAPVERLRALVLALLQAYEGADAVHKVQLNDLGTLPDGRRDDLRDFQRRLVALLADALRGINPRLAQGGRLLMPVTMSLFGMLNWQHLWFRPDGPMTREAYADLVTQMMVDGIAGLGEARRKLGQRVGV